MSRRPGTFPFRYSSMCLIYTACASILFLFAPLGISQVSTASGIEEQHASLLQLNGWRIVVVLALPVVFAAAPVFRRRSRHVRTLRTAAAVLLSTFVLLGILSIGLYYAPSAALMIAAAVKERSAPRASAVGYRPGGISAPSSDGEG